MWEKKAQKLMQAWMTSEGKGGGRGSRVGRLGAGRWKEQVPGVRGGKEELLFTVQLPVPYTCATKF